MNYTDASGDTNIDAYTVSASNPNTTDLSSKRLLLKIEQPFANHNGGMLLFGPDGFLYVGMGDGGSVGDPSGNAQNLGTLLGKMLRIQVTDSGYAVPPDNPFVGSAGARGEIWAYGLRNPWRYSFDPPTGRLFVGDVGQNGREEVDIVVRGGNNGWNRMEGSRCYPPGTECDATGLTLPIIDYPRGEGSCVVGGYIYRGNEIPELAGEYIYGDCNSANIWTATEQPDGSFEVSLALNAGLDISSFAEDLERNLYVLHLSAGTIERISR